MIVYRQYNYQFSQRVSCLAYCLVNLDFRGNLSYCNFIHQSVYQSFPTVSRLDYSLLQSFGFSGKSVLLFSLSSAFLSVFPDSLLYLYFRGNVSCCHLIHQSVFQSFQPVSCSSSVNLDVLGNLSQCNLIHQASETVFLQWKVLGSLPWKRLYFTASRL